MQTVRVVVRLPSNRPDQPLADPPRIEWNAEKADILWKVIARSRASDSGGTDWKGLAAHLEVPLPYLLYRAQTRYEEDLRGLQDIRGALSPTVAQTHTKTGDEFPISANKAGSSRLTGSAARMTSSTRLTTPLEVRARLNSLGNNSPRPRKASSSSILTLQGPRKTHAPLRPTTPFSSEEGTDSEDEAAAKEEQVDRNIEEQEALDRKLKDLQKMMTNDALGLVSSSRSKGKEREADRGRIGLRSPRPVEETLSRDALSSRSTSQSVSSASSPRGSIPSMPSPPPESQPQSPIARHLSPSKSSSPPAVSPRSAHGQSHLRYGPLVGRDVSERGSSQGSETSSFSDISDASLSASALESALMSNIHATSRLSAFTRSRFGAGRGRGVHL